MISLYQIYFDKTSFQSLESGTIPYYNEADNDYFENHVMKEVYRNSFPASILPQYIGITSWKQSTQSFFKAQEIVDAIQKDIDAGTEKDVYLYCNLPGIKPTYDFSSGDPHGELCATIRQPDIWHGNWHQKKEVKFCDELLNNSGVLPFDMFSKWRYSMRNYWIARKEIFDEYCKTVLLPAIEFFERPDIKAQLPKWYKHSHSQKLYNSCCFTMEGLFGSFLAHSNYSFKYLARKKYGNRFKDIRIDGYLPVPQAGEITNKLIEA